MSDERLNMLDQDYDRVIGIPERKREVGSFCQSQRDIVLGNMHLSIPLPMLKVTWKDLEFFCNEMPKICEKDAFTEVTF
jgi:hypothetical protein